MYLLEALAVLIVALALLLKARKRRKKMSVEDEINTYHL